MQVSLPERKLQLSQPHLVFAFQEGALAGGKAEAVFEGPVGGIQVREIDLPLL